MERQLVIFELANEFYGVDIAAVESIIKMQAITKVPHAPSFIEGVTNLRGKVVPVVDLRKRFSLDMEETTKDSRIVVVMINNLEVGMIVDGVSEVLTITENAIEPPPPMVLSIDSTYITGIAMLDNKLVILLDLGRVLSLEEKVLLQTA